MTLEEYIDVSEKYNRPFARPADKEDFYSKYIKFYRKSAITLSKSTYIFLIIISSHRKLI